MRTIGSLATIRSGSTRLRRTQGLLSCQTESCATFRKHDIAHAEYSKACKKSEYLPKSIARYIKQLISHEGFHRYFANTSWLFAEQVLRLTAGILVGAWVARYLGPLQFGLFSYSIAFAALFSGIAKLGLDGIVVRELINDPAARDAVLGTAFWLKLLGAIFTICIMALAAFVMSDDRTANLYIIIIGCGTIFQTFEVVDFYFQSQVLSKFVSLCKLAQLIVSSLLKIYLVLNGATLVMFVLISVVDQATLALSLYLAYGSRKLGSFYRSFNRKVAKQLLGDGWPLILGGMVTAVYMRSDQILIKAMLGEEQVGLYSAAVRLSEAWYIIPVVVTSSIYPALVNARKLGIQPYHARLRALYALMIWIAIGIAVPMTLVSGFLVTSLYGEAYRDAGPVLMVHIWTGVFVFMGVAFSRYLMVENMNYRNFFRTLLGAVSNIVLNLLLIPAFGIMGSAVATLIAQALVNYVYDYFDLGLRDQFYLKTLALVNPLNIGRGGLKRR